MLTLKLVNRVIGPVTPCIWMNEDPVATTLEAALERQVGVFLARRYRLAGGFSPGEHAHRAGKGLRGKLCSDTTPVTTGASADSICGSLTFAE